MATTATRPWDPPLGAAAGWTLGGATTAGVTTGAGATAGAGAAPAGVAMMVEAAAGLGVGVAGAVPRTFVVWPAGVGIGAGVGIRVVCPLGVEPMTTVGAVICGSDPATGARLGSGIRIVPLDTAAASSAAPNSSAV